MTFCPWSLTVALKYWKLERFQTEHRLYNQPEGDLVTLEGNKLKQVYNFKYLGSWMQSSEKDMNIRIGQAWSARNKMMKVWKSNQPNHLKVGFFRVTSVLLYGPKCWTMTRNMSNRLNGSSAEQFLKFPGRSMKPTKNCTATFLRLQIHWRSGDCGL